FFGIEKDTGKVYVKKNLTGRSKYGFVAQATDDGLPEVNTLGVQVNIFVRETNDFPPVFSEERYKGYVTEKENTDRVIAKVSATDRDLQNNTVTYKITSGNEDRIFLIESQEGNIRVNKTMAHKLNYDTKKQYILLVQAKDSHNSPQYGLTTVTIDVLDTNDHPPVFTKPAFSIGIPENKPAGHCFLKVEADSGDTVDNVTYSLGTKDVPFTVNQVSGELCTNLVLDREQKEKYEFNVVATDGKFESAVAVTLEVEDENDNPPQFERGRYAISIPQESKAGRSIAQLHARDPDAANNGEVTYWIKNTYGLFEIDPQTGLVRLASGLPDHVQRNTSFEMEVFAQDHGITSSISKTTLTVRVSNVRNHPPDFEQFAYTVAIDENLSNFPLLTVHASDVDSGEAGEIGYRIVRATRPEPFRIDQKSGKISLISPLDREQVKYLELVVEARDEAPEPQFVTTVVQITVNDINDNPPVFLSTPKFLRVPLSTSQREVIYQVEAVDKDSPFNGNNVIKYEILPPNPVFSIHPKTGQIFASQALSLGVHSLNIKASDSGEESLSSFIQLNVEIYKDSIDEPTPVFTSVQYDVTLDDLLQPGDSVLHVRATTPNGAPFSYGVKQVHNEHIKRFSIDPETGLVTAATRLDPQEEDLHHFLVTATSKTNSSHYVEAGVIVRLSGRNTRCPKFPFSEYYATVKENTAPDSAILPNLQVEEAEKFRKLSYLITEDNSEERFYIDYKIASSVSLRVKKRLDRDGMPSILQGVYTLTVRKIIELAYPYTH
ncbi:cadherin EGF LAG seven-pass G-type receptor 3-like, partial [Limulus polyphemus]|uniref:Cadherin EGF LAG seven-pass G-type receptor 3-like n=1 Tax=Limulus polyphemus TaxID=6850 RepID=A0ABM1C1M6_LIMPO